MSERRIDKDTLIPLSVLTSVIVIIVGAISWLTGIFLTAQANAEDIKKLQLLYEADQLTQSKYRKTLHSKIDRANERLARIEGKLIVIINNMEKKD